MFVLNIFSYFLSGFNMDTVPFLEALPIHDGLVNINCRTQYELKHYRKVASTNTSHLERYPGIYRLLMKEKLNAYAL